MDKNNSLEIKKEGFLKKIINKIKLLFGKKENDNFESNTNKVDQNKELKSNLEDKFSQSLKVSVDLEIFSLKVKLENNEIRAIDLTDEQIDELQKIYDKEILEKQNKIKRLKETA